MNTQSVRSYRVICLLSAPNLGKKPFSYQVANGGRSINTGEIFAHCRLFFPSSSRCSRATCLFVFCAWVAGKETGSARTETSQARTAPSTEPLLSLFVHVHSASPLESVISCGTSRFPACLVPRTAPQSATPAHLAAEKARVSRLLHRWGTDKGSYDCAFEGPERGTGSWLGA